MACRHRLWITGCWRCRTVAYLNEVIDQMRAREASVHLASVMSDLPTTEHVGRATPENTPGRSRPVLPADAAGPVSTGGVASTFDLPDAPPVVAAPVSTTPRSVLPDAPSGPRRGRPIFTP